MREGLWGGIGRGASPRSWEAPRRVHLYCRETVTLSRAVWYAVMVSEDP